jgi:hypothetical protein
VELLLVAVLLQLGVVLALKEPVQADLDEPEEELLALLGHKILRLEGLTEHYLQGLHLD